jgi:integrase
MTTAVPSAALATIQPVFTEAERVALAGFLAGYRGLTREAYALDLRQFTTWCRARSLALFAVRRADIEGFAPDLEARGRTRATVTRRLSTIAGFYRYAVEEELLASSPAAHVRRPRVDYESHAVALDRNELGALLVAAGLGTPGEHALISLLALNGLRVSEATGADIEHLGLERGHRTLTITPQGRQDRHNPAGAAHGPGDRPGPSASESVTRCSWPRTAGGWTGTAPGGSSARPPAAPGSPRPSRLTRFGTRSSPPP